MSIAVLSLIEGVLRELTMLKWKTVAVGLASVFALAGLGTVGAQRSGRESRPRPDSVRSTAKAKAGVPGVDRPLDAPPPFKIGDHLVVEVLEALPGRPIVGERVVRPDGTISLGFYGDLYVFGLNRKEIKVKVVEHLRKYLMDGVLGLREVDENGKEYSVAPADTNMVFVEEVPTNSAQAPGRDSVERKLDKLLDIVKERPADRERRSVMRPSDTIRPKSVQAGLDSLRGDPNEPPPPPPRVLSPDPRIIKVEEELAQSRKRIDDLERRLDQVIKALEAAKKE